MDLPSKYHHKSLRWWQRHKNGFHLAFYQEESLWELWRAFSIPNCEKWYADSRNGFSFSTISLPKCENVLLYGLWLYNIGIKSDHQQEQLPIFPNFKQIWDSKKNREIILFLLLPVLHKLQVWVDWIWMPILNIFHVSIIDSPHSSSMQQG